MTILDATLRNEVWHMAVYTHDDSARIDVQHCINEALDSALMVGISAEMSAEYLRTEQRSPANDEPATVTDRNRSKLAVRYAQRMADALESATEWNDKLAELEAPQRIEAVASAERFAQLDLAQRFARGNPSGRFPRKTRR